MGLIDIDWKRYDFERHKDAVSKTRPLLTIANDVVDRATLDTTLKQAELLNQWARWVVIVPKDPKLGANMRNEIPSNYILGYSVPTKYGNTELPVSWFEGRYVHLLGGRPDTQRRLATSLRVFSLDGNRVTLDAKYGDYFDGQRFKRHPVGGYETCLTESIIAADDLWKNYPAVIDVELDLADESDLPQVKFVADKEKQSIGFVLKSAVAESWRRGELAVARLNGSIVAFVRYRHRRDRVTKIYEICVDSFARRFGIGTRLLEFVQSEAMTRGHSSISLKCPRDLPANEFYKAVSYRLIGTEPGKSRALNIWESRFT